MKTTTKILAFLFLLINFGCSNYYDELQNAGFTNPTIKNQPRLLYPKAAQENSFSGKTEIVLLVSKTGKVDDVQIVKSSGYKVLDSAAVDYSKNLVFNPALVHGQPVSARVKWTVNFKFSDQLLTSESYIQQVKELYAYANSLTGSRRDNAMSEILDLHDQFVNSMWDGPTFNNTIEQVLLPGTSAGWDTLWDGYPLSFFVYHDFIQRFPDYKNLSAVKDKLEKSLWTDVQYIEQDSRNRNGMDKMKKALVMKIKNFMKNNYPDIKIEEEKNTDFNS